MKKAKEMSFDEKVEMCACCNVNNDLADLYLKYERAENYIKLLNKCLDVKEELCDFYRKENEELKEKLNIYEREK